MAINDDENHLESDCKKLALPYEYSQYLYFISYLMIIPFFTAIYNKYYDCALVVGILLFTSINYWRCPDYSWRRWIDIIAVQVCLWWMVFRNYDNVEPYRFVCYFFVYLFIISEYISYDLHYVNNDMEGSTFFHAIGHICGDIANTAVCAGIIPYYSDAWFLKF